MKTILHIVVYGISNVNEDRLSKKRIGTMFNQWLGTGAYII
jgi:hypothetical protein